MPGKKIELPDYPVKQAFGELKELLSKHNSLALNAPTGSGKTTLLPVLMHLSGLSTKKILVTQPRRLAAKSVAERISGLLCSKTGDLAGYRVRGESKISKDTKIEIVTEGYALGMLQADPFLSEYDWVILDEFHERHIEGDLLLAFIRDLKTSLDDSSSPGIILMSATWQGQPIERLSDFTFFSIEGRLFPVERIFQSEARRSIDPLKLLPDLVSRAIEETEGRILVFLPGRKEIERTSKLLSEAFQETKICYLYGGMRLSEQQSVLHYSGDRRQIILATAIAETSLTIENVTAVVDSGLERLSVYNPSRGVSSLVTRQVSRATSDQRAGRAGRLGPGKYYAAWTAVENSELIERRNPEILDGDLARAALQSTAWGSLELEWLSPPPDGPWQQAFNLLRELGAVDSKDKITPRGKLFASLPMHPRIAHMVTTAGGEGDAVFLAAALSADFHVDYGDGNFSDFINNLKSGTRSAALEKEVNSIKNIIKKNPAQSPISIGNISTAGLLSLAFPDRIGKRENHRYFQLSTGQKIECVAQGIEWAVFPVITINNNKARARLFEAANFDEIRLLHKNMIGLRNETTYNEKTGNFTSLNYEAFGKIIIKKLPPSPANASGKLSAVRNFIKKKGIEAMPFSKSTIRLLDRLRMAKSLGIEDLPRGDLQKLSDNIENWLAPWLSGPLNSEVLHNAISARLDWEQTQRIKNLFPDSIVIRKGQKKKIDYSNPAIPLIRGRMQEFFGLNTPICIAEGKLSLAVELLSPAMRPLQTTSDLGKFWKGSYSQIRSEMHGRYPKHYWPEDPASAEPSLATGKNRPE